MLTICKGQAIGLRDFSNL